MDAAPVGGAERSMPPPSDSRGGDVCDAPQVTGMGAARQGGAEPPMPLLSDTCAGDFCGGARETTATDAAPVGGAERRMPAPRETGAGDLCGEAPEMTDMAAPRVSGAEPGMRSPRDSGGSDRGGQRHASGMDAAGVGAAGRRMRAVRLAGPGLPPRLERVPMPTLRPDEALLKVIACGVCHTELQLMIGTLGPGVWPLTPGHEIVGEVVAGPQELVGRAVLVYYSRPCGECSFCRDSQEQVCPNAGPQPGLSTDGGFAEMVRVAADCLVALPNGLDPVEAAPLGCAAASALHALDAVAQVQPGETIVVYGVGGVGLALIQLGCLRGARVFAIGRSPTKLALARSYGAECVDASAGDPVLEVLRLTRGEGAHAVFELVGADETLEWAMEMVRRQGRLVLVGYGDARLPINPLKLVLRETRILSSLGNTRAELREVVRLAAAGLLRVPVAARYALEDADLALEDLRAGRLDGRGVLLPSLPPNASDDGSKASHGEEKASHEAAKASRGEEKASRGGEGASRGEEEASRGEEEASHGGQKASRPLEAELLAFVGRGIDAPVDDATFNDLALRLFAYQFANIRAYRLLCERRGRTPQSVHHWRDIPPVPIAAFKETLLAAEPIEAATEFNSSGTTRPEHKSRHFHPSLRLYDLNARLNFKVHVLPDVERMRCAVIFPHRSELPHSSLAHWLTLMVEAFGTDDSRWFVTNTGGLDADGLAAMLHDIQQPIDRQRSIQGQAPTAEELEPIPLQGPVHEYAASHEQHPINEQGPIRADGPIHGQPPSREQGQTHASHQMQEQVPSQEQGPLHEQATDRERGPSREQGPLHEQATDREQVPGGERGPTRGVLAREPICLLAASFGLVHFIEYCVEHDLRFALPPGSRVMDTGGYKGRSREYARDDLYTLVTDRLGIPESHIVNMYGMTEHGTQFLDNVLRDAVHPNERAGDGDDGEHHRQRQERGRDGDTGEGPGQRQERGGDGDYGGRGGQRQERFKVVPPWARTLVVDPDTLREQPPGQRGLLLHFDLINRTSAMAVLSEDVGRAVGDGFELFGRAATSEARGCSIALDELIEAVRHAGDSR